MADMILIPLGQMGVLRLSREQFEAALIPPQAQTSPQSAQPEAWLDSRQLAKLINVGDTTIESWAARGIIPCIRAGKALRFVASEVRAALELRPRDCPAYRPAQLPDPKGRKQARHQRATGLSRGGDGVL